MGRRVLLALPGVSSPGHDGILMHEDRPHGDLSFGRGLLRLPQRFVHEGFVGREMVLRVCFRDHVVSVTYSLPPDFSLFGKSPRPYKGGEQTGGLEPFDFAGATFRAGFGLRGIHGTIAGPQTP